MHNNALLLGSSVAEQVTVNHLVAGSNPARAAIAPTLPKVQLRPSGQFAMERSTAYPHQFGSLVRFLLALTKAFREAFFHFPQRKGCERSLVGCVWPLSCIVKRGSRS